MFEICGRLALLVFGNLNAFRGINPFKVGFASFLKSGLAFASKGRKSFPFRVDLFSEVAWCTGEQTESHKRFSLVQKNKKKKQKKKKQKQKKKTEK